MLNKLENSAQMLNKLEITTLAGYKLLYLYFKKHFVVTCTMQPKKVTELPKNPDGTETDETGQNIISFVETCFVVYLS